MTSDHGKVETVQSREGPGEVSKGTLPGQADHGLHLTIKARTSVVSAYNDQQF
jgi:hypothetical protein